MKKGKCKGKMKGKNKKRKQLNTKSKNGVKKQ